MADRFYEYLKPTHWLPDHVARISSQNLPAIPLIRSADIKDILPGFQLWDSWTIDALDGSRILFDGWRGWVMMCAPRNIHPDMRHDIARLRLMMERDGEWCDCGYLLPENLNPGSREWAGSCVLDSSTCLLTLFFTATGRRGETARSYEQRLFQVQGHLSFAGGQLKVSGWGPAIENVIADGIDYVVVNQQEGQPGLIKGFRDPYHFFDPVSEVDYLLFTASANNSTSSYNGLIGLARSTNGSMTDWQLLPPLISSDGLNNELERPICRTHGGRYFVFWSTQSKTFAPGCPAGPNGLYGMVAENFLGPYRPLNGSGLVASNPPEEPFQTYSWWVDSELNVTGFIDLWGLQGADPVAQPDLVTRHFGGVPAPAFRIAIEGDSAHIVTP